MSYTIAPPQSLTATQLSPSAVDGVTVDVTGGKAMLNLGNANTWTGSQTFNGGVTVPFAATSVIPAGGPNLIANGDFSRYNSTSILFKSIMSISSTWTTQAGSFTFANTVSPPSAAPTLTAVTPSSATGLAAGTYYVAYTWTNAYGQTTASPTASVAIAAGQAVQVSALSLPPGVTGVDYYMSTAAGSTTLGYVASGNGTAINLTTYGNTTAPPSNNSAFLGATSSAVGSLITGGNPNWKPLTASDSNTPLPLTAQAAFTMPSSVPTSTALNLVLWQSAGNYYQFYSNGSTLYLAKVVGGTQTVLASVAYALEASTAYTATLTLSTGGALTANLYLGVNSNQTSLLQTLSATDTSLSGEFLMGLGGDTNVVIANAAVFGPVPDNWSTFAGENSISLVFTTIPGSDNGAAVSLVHINDGQLRTNFPVVAGQTYSASWYSWVPSGSTATVDAQVIDPNGNLLLTYPSTTPSTTPQRFTATFTAQTTGYAQFAVRSVNGPPNEQVYWWGIRVEVGATASAWAPMSPRVFDVPINLANLRGVSAVQFSYGEIDSYNQSLGIFPSSTLVLGNSDVYFGGTPRTTSTNFGATSRLWTIYNGAPKLAPDTALYSRNNTLDDGSGRMTAVSGIALGTNAPITGAPTTAPSNTGWGISLYGSSYAIGIAASTIALGVGIGTATPAWVSTFGPYGYPANNATASVPDSASTVSLSSAFNLGTAVADGIVVRNPTQATSSATVQNAPAIHLQGYAWNTSAAASQSVDFREYVAPISGNPTVGQWHLQSSINGSSWADVIVTDQAGNTKVTGSILVSTSGSNWFGLEPDQADPTTPHGSIVVSGVTRLLQFQLEPPYRARFTGPVYIGSTNTEENPPIAFGNILGTKAWIDFNGNVQSLGFMNARGGLKADGTFECAIVTIMAPGGAGTTPYTTSTSGVLITNASSNSNAAYFCYIGTLMPTASYVLEVQLFTTSGGTAYAALYDLTSNAQVSGSTVSTTETGPTTLRTAALALTANSLYTVQIWSSSASYNAYITAARIIAIL